MNAETFKKLGEKFQGNIQRVFLLSMGVLLILRVLIWIVESSFEGDKPVNAVPKGPAVVLAKDNPVYLKVRGMIDVMPEFDKSDYHGLIEFNMFDAKQVGDAVERERRVRERMQEAWAAFDLNDFPKARQIADECLKVMPNYWEAKMLIKRINVKLGLTEEGTTKTLETTTPGLLPNPAPPPAGGR